ncbi:MAG: hypothetical protein IAI49_10895 [Candidatus Eremiobacteraeota bacterium]|nr:hypothetical protein [Candidatus Eremiobacteraeota bacterium]
MTDYLGQITAALSPPNDRPPLEALAAIAGVAIVAWTGVLILYVWAGERPKEPESVPLWIKRVQILSLSLDFLQTSFIGALITMLASPSWLRGVAAINFLYYARQHFVSFRKMPKEKTGRYKLGEVLIDLAMLAIAIYPAHMFATAIVLALLWCGYQNLFRLLPEIWKHGATIRSEPPSS